MHDPHYSKDTAKKIEPQTLVDGYTMESILHYNINHSILKHCSLVSFRRIARLASHHQVGGVVATAASMRLHVVHGGDSLPFSVLGPVVYFEVLPMAVVALKAPFRLLFSPHEGLVVLHLRPCLAVLRRV
jgi:hypothetical protein